LGIREWRWRREIEIEIEIGDWGLEIGDREER